MFGSKKRNGQDVDHEEDDELSDKTRQQYLTIMQYLVEHELLEALSALERETSVTWREGSLKVASVLESSLDMFAKYSDKQSQDADAAQNDELMQLESGICCTSQSSEGPSEAFSTNVIAVSWVPGPSGDQLFGLVATADRRVRYLSPEGATLAEFADFKSPVLSLDTAPVEAAADCQSIEIVATTMGGEVLLLQLMRPPASDGGYPSSTMHSSGVAELQLVEQYKNHAKQATLGRFSPLLQNTALSKHFVTVSRDHKANLYTRCGSGHAKRFSLAGTVELGGEVTSCCWASSQIFALSARDSHQLHYWNVNGGGDGKLKEHMKTSLNVNNDVVCSFAVLALTISEDRKLIAACTDKSRVIVLKTFTGTQLRNLYGATVDEYDVPSVCFSLDRSFLYTTSSLSSRSVEKRKEQAEEFGEDVTDMCGEIAVFEVRTGRLALRLACHEKPVRCMSHHPHTEAIITGSFDKHVKYWT